jgi:benzoate/toluate 1,2-dioxygenase beta subunit
VELLSQDGEKICLRFNWLTLSYRYRIVDTYFGVSFYTLDASGTRPLIKAKKVILKNDYVHHVIDVYHV